MIFYMPDGRVIDFRVILTFEDKFDGSMYIMNDFVNDDCYMLIIYYWKLIPPIEIKEGIDFRYDIELQGELCWCCGSPRLLVDLNGIKVEFCMTEINLRLPCVHGMKDMWPINGKCSEDGICRGMCKKEA